MGAYEDKYCYPGTDIPRNAMNIRDPAKLKEFDAMVTTPIMSTGSRDLMTPTVQGLQAAHKRLFQQVYPDFAGQLRSVNMGRTTEDGRTIPFMNGEKVGPELDRLMKTVSVETRRIGGRASMEDFTDRAANYLAQLNRIHPFPDGNGRIQQLFLQSVGNRFGYRVDLTKEARTHWAEASIDSFRQGEGDAHFKMRLLIEDSSSRQRTGQLDREDKLEELRARYREAGQDRPKQGDRDRQGGGQKI